MINQTETNSGDDSKGSALGFDGNEGLLIVAAVAVSILGTMVCYHTKKDPFITWSVFLLPVPIAVVYLKVFVNKKPPCYQSDLISQWMGNTSIERPAKMENPYLKD